jgi:hypothetical protein
VRSPRRTLHTVVDVLHFFVLQGDEQPRDDVVAYLRRATAARSQSIDSSLRAYERFKATLRELGIEFRSGSDADGAAFLAIPRPAEAKARIEALLDGRHTCRNA